MAKKKETDKREMIVDLLKDKSIMKQDVYKNTIQTFGMMRELCKEVSADLKSELEKVDKRVSLSFLDVNVHAFQLKVAGDMLELQSSSGRGRMLPRIKASDRPSIR